MNFGKRQARVGAAPIVAKGAYAPAKGAASVPPQAAPTELAAPYQQTNDDPLQVGGPIPQSIGRVADLYSDVRQLRLGMEKEVEAVKARETQLREHIINNLSKSDDTGAAGLRYRAQIVMKDVPRVVDWPSFWDNVIATRRTDLVQKRISDKAVKDMIAAGEQVPGVEIAHIPDVSITKV